MIQLIVLIAALQSGYAETTSLPAHRAEQSGCDEPFPVPLYSPKPASTRGCLSLHLGQQAELVLSQTLCQADLWRWDSWLSSTGAKGWSIYRYLGRDFAVSIGLEARVSKIGLPMHLNWYPLEGVLVSIGFDALGFRPLGSASFQP